MSKMICFDMDGTVADLYGYTGWLECLRSENPAPYINAAPLVDMDRLRRICRELRAKGWEIRVISWLAMDSSESYKEAVRQAKRDWINRYMDIDKVHLVAYGTTKANCVRKAGGEQKILVDDNAKIRDGWHLGATIDATDPNWLDELEALI